MVFQEVYESYMFIDICVQEDVSQTVLGGVIESHLQQQFSDLLATDQRPQP